jgi:hypothetical protein
MRRIVITALVAAVIAPSASAAVPRLVITKSNPLVVTGSHFKPRERVTISLGQSTRQVRTTRLGSFQASFADVAFDRCSGWRITAAGALGDHALLVQPRVMCAPASTG